MSILKDAQVPETKFGETLVDQVDGRMHVQGNRGLRELASVHKGIIGGENGLPGQYNG